MTTAAASMDREWNVEKAMRDHGDSRKSMLKNGGVFLSVAGIIACNYTGFGLGKAVCQGLLTVALSSKLSKR